MPHDLTRDGSAAFTAQESVYSYLWKLYKGIHPEGTTTVIKEKFSHHLQYDTATEKIIFHATLII